MYQAILTRRYLVRKVIPLLAMLSVALCTAMVIIVLSVMNGFLDMVTQAGRKLIGDVAVHGPVTGFAWYDEVLAELRRLPSVEAASPMIETYGLLKMPYNQISQVQVAGIDPASYDLVTGYGATMYWRPLSPKEQVKLPETDIRRQQWKAPDFPDAWQPLLHQSLFDPRFEPLRPVGPVGIRNLTPEWQNAAGSNSPLIERLQKAGESLRTPSGAPGVVLGVRISIANEPVSARSYQFDDTWFMPTREVTLTVLPLTEQGGLGTPESRIFPVVNEFAVERYDIDSSYVFVPFDDLQKMLKMQPMQELSDRKDELGDPIPTGRLTPGRATRIVIKAAPGVAPSQLQQETRQAYERVYDRHVGEMPPPSMIGIKTWEEQIAQYIGAVKKETALVTTLFAIISLVAVVLVLAIFWTVVQQKTRDIGILRAVGASRLGITWLFLRYGTALGVLGVILGSILAHLIVWNINPIHHFLGEEFGIVIWDPKVYVFDEVPHTVNPLFAGIVMAAGVLFAIVGALIPAIHAAMIDPVTALRYE